MTRTFPTQIISTLLLLPLLITAAILLASARPLTGMYWEIGGTAHHPTNDCGRNLFLQLDLGDDDACTIGAVSTAIVKRQVQERNAQLDKTDPLPDSIGGFPVSGRVGVIDMVLAGWARIFTGGN